VRADRLLAILMMLQSRGRMTAHDIAEELEVSERTVYRDMEALSMAGVPVVAERGPGGGCALMEGYRTNLTGLSEPELRALFLATLPGPLGDLGMGKQAEAAMLKLAAALPSSQREGVEKLRKRLYLDSAEWFRHDKEQPHLRLLQDAVWEDRRICLGYRRSDGVTIKRFVDPYGLVAKGNIWYMVGNVPGPVRPLHVSKVRMGRRDIRVYRVSRIQSIELTGDTFDRDESFDLVSYWAEWCAQFEESLPRYPVRLLLSEEAFTVLPSIFGDEILSRIERKGEPDQNGWTEVEMVFQTQEAACSYLLGFGEMARVLEPHDLRERVPTTAARVAGTYTRT
jgi:predicted DNA-binding transcriptional regulator YafY